MCQSNEAIKVYRVFQENAFIYLNGFELNIIKTVSFTFELFEIF